MLIKINDSSYELYASVLMRKEQIQKEALYINDEYLICFGEGLIKLFQAKISCIELKKKIGYCQRQVNLGSKINENEMINFIELVMSSYYDELAKMKKNQDTIKSAEVISEYDVKRIKQIYLKLARKLHPDLNPNTEKDPQLMDFWNRIQMAYRCNNLKEITELEFLVSRYLDDDISSIVIDDIKTKIEKIEHEIDMIMTSVPYTYKFILNDESAIEKTHHEIQQEIDYYTKYHEDLEKVLETYMIERMLS